MSSSASTKEEYGCKIVATGLIKSALEKALITMKVATSFRGESMR